MHALIGPNGRTVREEMNRALLGADIYRARLAQGFIKG